MRINKSTSPSIRGKIVRVLAAIALLSVLAYWYNTNITDKLQDQNTKSMAYVRISEKITNAQNNEKILNEPLREIIVSKYKHSLKLLRAKNDFYAYEEIVADVMIGSYLMGVEDGYEKHKKGFYRT
jgi:hypothetical protein